eukprot:13667820-Alexandrium_andersonii.AAC.1
MLVHNVHDGLNSLALIIDIIKLRQALFTVCLDLSEVLEQSAQGSTDGIVPVVGARAIVAVDGMAGLGVKVGSANLASL